MKRHALITLAFAALFGLRAPICAYTCLETGSVVEVSQVPSSEHPPCHDPAPEHPEPDAHDCDCEQIRLVVSNSDVKKAYESEVPPAPSLAVSSFALPRVGRAPADTWRRHESLPPPDILLLNATLLL